MIGRTVRAEGRGERGRPTIGFLGAGWIGQMRLRSLALSGNAAVCAVADPSGEARYQSEQIVPGVALVEKREELFQFDLDGVVIASPSALHSEDATAALLRGFAVFCEKPLGCSAAQTSAAVTAAKRANRFLVLDFPYRFTAGLARLREIIREGVLGPVYALDLTFHNSYGPDKAWFYNPELSGGGCLIDLGIHLLDAALWVLDYPDAAVVQTDLFQRGIRLQRPVQNTVEDYVTATLTLGTNISARLACSWLLPCGHDAIIQILVHGTHASAEFHNVNGSFYDFRADLYRGRERHELCAPPDDWGGRGIISWARRLANDKSFDPAVESVLRVSELIDAIYGREGAA
jgi:predicted dehydrogenase